MAAFARNTPFGAAGHSSSWADDDDLDTEPLPVASTLPKVEEQEQQRAESPRREERGHRERKYSNDSRDHNYDRRGRGGYEDRGERGGYRNERPARGGYEGEPRPKNPVPDHGPYRAFLGNLSFRLTEHDLVDFIGSPDSITDIRIQRDRDDRPKGFAWVEFRDRDALVAALELDGQNLDGRAVRIDVASERERERKPRNDFYEKRGDRSDRPRQERRQDDAPRERPRLQLAPRTADTKPAEGANSTPKPSIFGEAKPRDENAFWERKKAKDAELKELAKKAPRKVSHDDADGHAAGRGRGGRGERSERGGRGGRGAQPQSEAPAKKDEPKPKAVEPKAKATEPKLPKTAKLAPPPSTKTKNLFAALGGDDSDSD